MRFHINSQIKISTPRVSQNCCICTEQINLGLIIYMAHESYNTYAWMHIHCLKEALPSKMKGRYQLIGTVKHIDPGGACSFCNRKSTPDAPLLSLYYFYMHPGCINKCYAAAKEVYEKNESEIIARQV
jgi:hypothetical protein